MSEHHMRLDFPRQLATEPQARTSNVTCSQRFLPSEAARASFAEVQIQVGSCALNARAWERLLRLGRN